MFPFFYKYAEQFCQQVGSREKQNPFVFLNIYFPSCLLDSNSYLTCLGEDDDSIRVVVVDNLNAWGTATCRFVILFSLPPPHPVLRNQKLYYYHTVPTFVNRPAASKPATTRYIITYALLYFYSCVSGSGRRHRRRDN